MSHVEQGRDISNYSCFKKVRDSSTSLGMTKGRLATLHRLTILGCVLICSALPAAPLERSISPSRQFIIFGGNRILRSAVSDAAERVKSRLLALLQSRDRWSVPILLNLQRPQANAPEVPPVLRVLPAIDVPPVLLEPGDATPSGNGHVPESSLAALQGDAS